VEIRLGNILVVDDDALNRRMLCRVLEGDGHTVRVAENGRMALELLAAEPADVVLLDIVMPELDGIEVLERMKASPDLRHVPVVMISGVDDSASVIHCIEAGADDFLPKPFDAVVLRARINAGLDRKRLHDIEHEWVRRTFSRFLPESVADEILSRNEGDPSIAPELLVGTIMFADLRGFTGFAESRSAPQVLEVLNRYHELMSDAILDNHGTLVHYTGDGMLAAFGAPLARVDHADCALEAACEMTFVRLEAFNEWFRDAGIGPGFRMGIGLNTGPVVSGSVGSSRRLDYAVIGDTVNTASRIEGLTKEAPFPILIADETRTALQRTTPQAVYVDEFELRGRQSRVKVWGLQAP
jgi:adenylate cyclase